MYAKVADPDSEGVFQKLAPWGVGRKLANQNAVSDLPGGVLVVPGEQRANRRVEMDQEVNSCVA
ncbi:hypothetical protein BH11ACT6_BH11ACT6_44390 [soil metagenome]